MKALEGVHRPPDGVLIELPLEKDALAQADHQFFAMKLADPVARPDLMHVEADGVGAEVDDR
jgi:hypothetical protein